MGDWQPLVEICQAEESEAHKALVRLSVSNEPHYPRQGSYSDYGND